MYTVRFHSSLTLSSTLCACILTFFGKHEADERILKIALMSKLEMLQLFCFL